MCESSTEDSRVDLTVTLASDQVLQLVGDVGEPTDETNTLRADIKALVDRVKGKRSAFFQVTLALLLLAFTTSRACQ